MFGLELDIFWGRLKLTMSTCGCRVYTLNFLAIFSFVFSTAEPLDKNNDANKTQYMWDLAGLLAGLLGVGVHALGEVALSPESAPLVDPVGALGLSDNILNQEESRDYQG